MSVMPTSLQVNLLRITTVVAPVVGLVPLAAHLVVRAVQGTAPAVAPPAALAVAGVPVLGLVPAVVAGAVQAVALVVVAVVALVAVVATVASSVADKGREKWRLR